jgi:hypothetical protein
MYLVGSLRNPEVPIVGNILREIGWDVFDDWHGAGHEADDKWKEYEHTRGRSYADALRGHAAKHIFQFDKTHLDRCDAGLLVYPAGRSGHLELGYMTGKGKPTYFLIDKPDRWDVMVQFAFVNGGEVFFSVEELALHFGSIA